MTQMNPYEFVIYNFLERHEGRRFTASEIATHCQINIRTAQGYSDKLVQRKLIRRESSGRRTVFYYEEQ